jgi:hypothetical protein
MSYSIIHSCSGVAFLGQGKCGVSFCPCLSQYKQGAKVNHGVTYCRYVDYTTL